MICLVNFPLIFNYFLNIFFLLYCINSCWCITKEIHSRKFCVALWKLLLPHTSHLSQFFQYWNWGVGCATEKKNLKSMTKLKLDGNYLPAIKMLLVATTRPHVFVQIQHFKAKKSPLEQNNCKVSGKTPWFNIKPKKGKWFSHSADSFQAVHCEF